MSDRAFFFICSQTVEISDNQKSIHNNISDKACNHRRLKLCWILQHAICIFQHMTIVILSASMVKNVFAKIMILCQGPCYMSPSCVISVETDYKPGE